MALLRLTAACITIVVMSEVLRASVAKSVTSDSEAPPGIQSKNNHTFTDSGSLSDLVTSPSENVASVSSFTSSSSSGAPVVTEGHSATVTSGGYEYPPPPVAVAASPVAPVVQAVPAVPHVAPIAPFPAVPAGLGLGGLGGIGALPFATGLLPFKSANLDVQVGGYYPVLEKAILVIGGGVLLLILFAFFNVAISKGGYLSKLGLGMSKAFAGAGSWDVDDEPIGKSGSVAGAASFAASSNLGLTNRVNNAIDRRF